MTNLIKILKGVLNAYIRLDGKAYRGFKAEYAGGG